MLVAKGLLRLADERPPYIACLSRIAPTKATSRLPRFSADLTAPPPEDVYCSTQ
jgi:hypothetical protein